MLGLAPETATLRRVKVHSPERDTLRVRWQLERALRGVQWMPSGVGPAAVLLVRRLAVRSGTGRAPVALDQLVSSAMRELAARAHRPWLQGDAAAADAVVFADEAELIACFARDWLRGHLAGRWWWRSLLLDATAGEWLRREALPRPERLVPAMAMLSTRGLAAVFVARLEPSDCNAAIASVVRAFAVPLDGPASAPVPAATRAQRGAKAGALTAGRAPASEGPPAALRRLLREVPELGAAALDSGQQRLLALSLVLTRAPTWARRPEMAIALEALGNRPPEDTSTSFEGFAVDARRASLHGAPAPLLVVRERVASQAQQPGPPRPPVTPPPSPDGPVTTAAGVTALPSPVSARAEPVEASAAGIEPALVDGASTVGEGAPARAASMPPMRDPENALDDVRVQPEAAGGPSRLAGREQPADRSRTATRFGGLFYLLNAALDLGVYGDFTRPLSSSIGLSPWDWLALVGRAWFGDDLVEDAVWGVLADLAGREQGEEPGRDFEPSSAGWFARHLGELEARLVLGLGVPEGEALRALVARHDARVQVTAATVHVFLALDALPLPIRIAGLDRDPGWIPAAGRDVRFFFD